MKTALHLQNCAYCGQASHDDLYCCPACRTLDQMLNGAPTEAKSDLLNSPFAYLDQENFQSIYSHSKTTALRDFVFFAKGLHCSSCVHTLEKLNQYCPSIESSRVNFAASTVSVRLTPEGSLARAADAIASFGYEPTPLAPEESTRNKEAEENKSALRRIAVAGFCAGNMMLFVIPIYSGLAGSMKDIFNWLSFLLFLPVLFFSAIPFFQGAWTSLRYRLISVDMPIAIALIAGFLFSTVNLVRGDGDIYYDSTASFLFFILCARYLLKTVQRRQLAAPSLQNSLKMEKYQKLSLDGLIKLIPFRDVLKGDRLIIEPDQTFPADARLLSSSALVDMSLFNGESLPKHFTKEMAVLGGTKNLRYAVEVQIQESFETSKIGKLCKQLESSHAIRNKFTALTDKLAQKLIVSVFATAVIFFIVYSQIDVSEAFNRSLALIVLACPCALAFGAPLTYGMALRRALRRGIIVKDPNVFEKLLTIENLFFDKTGTLSEGRLCLTHTEPIHIPDSLKRIALSLESASYHPVAFALREAWPEAPASVAVADVREILGYGIEGIVDGAKYTVRTLAESTHEHEIAIEILKDGSTVARLYFADGLRDDSAGVIQELRKQGLQSHILSGDRSERCQAIAFECGIPASQCHGDLFPEDKESILSKYRNTCMIGDGANDSLSLTAADIGIAVKGSVDMCLTYSSVYFTRGGLKPLSDLFQISYQTKKVLRRNLTISLVYNAIGGTLALLGFIDPLLAAVLMPLSSGAIIASSVWGFR